ncbi:HAD-IIIC family phosphatase [Halomonas sp. TP35]
MKIITDFNSTGLERIVTNLNSSIYVEQQPYGQFMQSIYTCIEQGYDDLVFLWLDFSSWSQSYGAALNFEPFDRAQLDDDLNNYVALITQLSGRCKGLLVANFVLPAYMQGSGLSNLSEGNPGFLLAELNLKLYKALSTLGNAWCLDQNRWFQSDGFYNGKLYHAGKIPFNQKVFRTVAEDLIAAIEAINGRSRKLLVLDLDNTLWGGILGDDGLENLKLGAPGAIGEAFAQFQKEIRALKNRGIALAIASKNYEDNALEAIRSHPEMQLKLEDFSAWHINWEDKAANILAIANDLNIGLHSVVFIDDNPVERGRIAEALPEVFVPEWPEDPCEYVTALRKLTCFSVASLSTEDRQKTKMFLQEKQRSVLKANITDKSEWLASLEMKLTIENVYANNISRVVQLLNKTNQFNLRTRRLTQGELERWLKAGNQMFAFRVADRFGDMGLTGLVGLSLSESRAELADFILSCRVMGRDVERAMLDCAVRYAQSIGIDQLEVCYEKTAKNRPVYEFMKRENIITDDNFNGVASAASYQFSLDFFEVIDLRYADR